MTPTGGHCERARAWVSLRADGELSELEQALLEAHLARCAGCRAFADGVAGAAALVRAQPLEPLARPVELRRAGSGRSLRVLHASAAAAVVATGCLAALVAGIFHVTSGPPAPALQRVSVVDDESPRTARELRRTVLAASAPRVSRHLLFP